MPTHKKGWKWANKARVNVTPLCSIAILVFAFLVYTKKGLPEGDLAQPSPWLDNREGIPSSSGHIKSELENVESGLPLARWTREQRRTKYNCRVGSDTNLLNVQLYSSLQTML